MSRVRRLSHSPDTCPLHLFSSNLDRIPEPQRDDLQRFLDKQLQQLDWTKDELKNKLITPEAYKGYVVNPVKPLIQPLKQFQANPKFHLDKRLHLLHGCLDPAVAGHKDD